MSEELDKVDDAPVPDTGKPEADEEESELLSLAVDDGKGGKMVPLSALVGAKQKLRDATKRVKELEPVAQRVTEIEGRLEKAAPYINAMLTDPAIAAAVTRKTNPSAAKTEQPENDPDATEYADAMRWYTDNGELDVARAQRAIKVQERIAERTSTRVVQPFANVTVGSAADRNLQYAMGLKDNDGVPLATEESIREVASVLPAHLLANPEVMDLVINNAIGVDRRKGRTPKAPEEPLLLDSVGGRRRTEPAITSEERARLQRLGLDEKRYGALSGKLEQAAASRKAITLGE